jgi:hypothetical protein
LPGRIAEGTRWAVPTQSVPTLTVGILQCPAVLSASVGATTVYRTRGRRVSALLHQYRRKPIKMRGTEGGDEAATLAAADQTL